MKNNYVFIYKPNHPNARKYGKIKRSRLIMSEHIKRPLKNGEHVHHINGIRSDDRIENLIIMTKSAHSSLHTKGDKHPNYKINRTKICPNCDKDFTRKDKKSHFQRDTCCSAKCRIEYFIKERASRSKISQEIADKIRTYKGVLPSRKVAAIFNISKNTVLRIWNNESWA